MPYDFTLMRFPRPTPPGLAGPEPGPQAILRGQVRKVLGEMPGVSAAADGQHYTTDLAAGQHVDVFVDPRDPPEFLTVEFARYATQDDYAAVRAFVDTLAEQLRLTITDDPDVGALPEAEEAGGAGSLMSRIRGLFGR